MAPTAGVLLAHSKPFDPTLTDAEFNDWYSNKHLPDVIHYGLASVGVRYKNANPSSQWPYLAIYRMPEVEKFYDPVYMSSGPADSPKSWGSGSLLDVAKAELSAYRHLGTFEAKNAKDGTAAVLVISTDGSKSTISDNFKSHLRNIEQLKGYRRSILLEATDATSIREGDKKGQGGAGERKLGFISVHEFDEIPSLDGLLKEGDYDVWQYISEYGTGLYVIEPTHGRR